MIVQHGAFATAFNEDPSSNRSLNFRTIVAERWTGDSY